MAILISSIVVAVGIYMIVLPLFSRRTEPALQNMLGVATASGTETALEREKVFTMLGELEYDYRMDKIAAEDYDELRASLAEKAAQLVQEEHVQGQVDDVTSEETEEERAIEQALEAELQRIVAQLGGADGGRKPPSAPAPATTQRDASTPPETAAQKPSADFGFCPECGVRLLRGGQKFCHACGTPLDEEVGQDGNE